MQKEKQRLKNSEIKGKIINRRPLFHRAKDLPIFYRKKVFPGFSALRVVSGTTQALRVRCSLLPLPGNNYEC